MVRLEVPLRLVSPPLTMPHKITNEAVTCTDESGSWRTILQGWSCRQAVSSLFPHTSISPPTDSVKSEAENPRRFTDSGAVGGNVEKAATDTKKAGQETKDSK